MFLIYLSILLSIEIYLKYTFIIFETYLISIRVLQLSICLEIYHK
jgi:hypothetical protein